MRVGVLANGWEDRPADGLAGFADGGGGLADERAGGLMGGLAAGWAVERAGGRVVWVG